MGRLKRRIPPAGARVVVMYGRSLMSLVIAHSLGKRGVEVIGCDDVELTVLSFSRYVTRTFVHEPLDQVRERFLQDLEGHLRKLIPGDGRPYVLMPVFRETEIIAANRERFERFMKVAAPPFDAIAAVHPKDRLRVTAERLGVPIPRTWDLRDSIRNPVVIPPVTRDGTTRPRRKAYRNSVFPSGETRLPDTLNNIVDTITSPALIKPPDDVGGRGIVRCETPAELRREIREYLQRRGELPLLQEYAPGDDYCLTVLFEGGELVASMAYRNLYRYPVESGAGIVRETVDDTPFLDPTRRLLGPLGWHGIAELDFRWSPEGDRPPLLLEVNPRFWAGLFQTVESGLDIPWLLFQLTLEGHVEAPAPIAIGKRTKIPGLWLLSAVRDISGSEARFERVRAAWREARDSIEQRQIREAFRQITASLEGGTGFRETFSTLRGIIREGRRARNDLFFRDDPFIVLGVLFVLASLIRYGKLPPEVKNR